MSTITEKLQRVLQTMTNDDTSAPRSPNRERFVERSNLLLEVISSLEAPTPENQMVGWQDISTAPKTGEEFIARTGPEWSSFSCAWDGEMFVHYDRDDGIIAYGPKQWMPMPGPETATAKLEDQP